ncbi:hypothetical protein FNV43_RR24602 [Rhamnella rubrinervis]|uniref:Uncharacterized protein n=1 Tax=Rhamnella rubrinervis TaxID=2594499 RepID=A0A8K0DTD9_9ROSA|nr:hypothetical protein FNV43_RR24602 [Rhamnella rubrinervis]
MGQSVSSLLHILHKRRGALVDELAAKPAMKMVKELVKKSVAELRFKRDPGEQQAMAIQLAAQRMVPPTIAINPEESKDLEEDEDPSSMRI